MASPKVKFEHYELSPADSVADSFVSTPGSNFPLFPPTTMNPQEVMTPQSFNDDDFEHSVSGTPQPTPSSSEKKPVKKRKSWGQQLPEPKTNLPPRKRAKTEDEKEQRRVERVLRNRRAAQSSRERKRQEVEALEAEKRDIERRNRDLQLRLQDMEQKYHELEQRMQTMSNGAAPTFNNNAPATTRTDIPRANSPLEGTLAPELSGFRDIEQLSTPQKTINPASISPSPEMRPVDFSNASSSDMTQHPAAMLCANPDLPCQSEEQRPWTFPLVLSLFITMISACSSNILEPLTRLTTSLRMGQPLPATPSILNLIIWIVTTTAPLTRNSTSMTTSTTTQPSLPRPRFSLRIRLLRRLLACSPHLARPLMDATLGAMRSASDQLCASDDCVEGKVGVAVESSVRRSPSKLSFDVGSMMTLLWATQCLEREYLRNGFINMEVNDEEGLLSSSSSPYPNQSSSLSSLDGDFMMEEEEFRLSFIGSFDDSDEFLAWDQQNTAPTAPMKRRRLFEQKIERSAAAWRAASGRGAFGKRPSGEGRS